MFTCKVILSVESVTGTWGLPTSATSSLPSLGRAGRYHLPIDYCIHLKKNNKSF